MRHLRQQRRVGPAAERDDDTTEVAQRARRSSSGCRHRVAPMRLTRRARPAPRRAADHAGVEGPELGVEGRGLVEAHLVDAVLQVVGVDAEERHAPLVVVEPGRTGDDLQDAAVERAADLAVPEHQLLARLEVEAVPVVPGSPRRLHIG